MGYISGFSNKKFEGRYLSYFEIEEYLKQLPKTFEVEVVGYSVLKRPIYSVSWGSGATRILAWSQMHGDETTTTKAVLDFMEWTQEKEELSSALSSKISLKIIPVLNPDGAISFTRSNANAIDLNRDALHRTQPESRLLQRVGADFNPDFAFNMHDQDPIYGVGKTGKSAILSFLAPGMDDQRSIPPTRKRALQLIAGIFRELNPVIPGHIGRYKDEFNPHCMGEYFQMQGVSTVLFESGHIGQDYSREKVRTYVFNAFIMALHIISEKNYKDYVPEHYFAIPPNMENFYDLIVRQVQHGGEIKDVAFQFKKQLIKGAIHYQPRVCAIENLKNYHGHREIQGNGRKINGISKEKIRIDDIMNEITLNNEKILINLTNN